MKISWLMILAAFIGVNSAEAALYSRDAKAALSEIKSAHHGDPDLGAFATPPSPEASGIMDLSRLSKEAYREKLEAAFTAFKVHAGLTAAGHAPASHSGVDLKAAVAALHADRDNELAEKNALTVRVQPHVAGGETVAAAVAGGAHFHSDARYLAYGVAERAVGDAAGRVAERAVFDATIQRNAPGDDITAVYSRTKYNADVAAATAVGNAAGQAAKLLQAEAELNTLEAFVRQQETDGHIAAGPRDAILGDIARARAAIR